MNENSLSFQKNHCDEKIQNLTEEIDSLKNELNKVNIINDKLNNLLLLEIESNSDKLKQSQNEYGSIISSLSDNISHKDELLLSLSSEIENLKDDIHYKDDMLLSLSSQINNLKDEIANNNKSINNFKDELS